MEVRLINGFNPSFVITLLQDKLREIRLVNPLFLSSVIITLLFMIMF